MVKTYLIIGTGKTGNSVINLLKELGQNYIVLENSSQKIDLQGIDVIIKSPSVPLWDDLLVQAREKGIEIISDVELFYCFTQCKAVAVSGTNGKTTICTLLQKILGKKSKAIGNIGDAACNHALMLGKKNIAILECSSYQLESIKDFKPHIAILSNLGIDHLEHHLTMQNYVASKFKMFKNMTHNEFAVINFEDKVSMENVHKIPAKKYFFSSAYAVTRGVFVHKDKFYFIDKKLEYICHKNDLKIFGEHNYSNIAACICAAKLLKISNKRIRKTLTAFYGIEHRLELVKNIGKIQVFNDSKSTNCSSCIAACRAFSQKITLIAGGQKSDEDYENMFAAMPLNVRNIVLFGETTEMFAEICTNQNKNFIKCESLKEAIEKSLSLTKDDGIVLFSPACKSFDSFENFEHRGKVFKEFIINI